MSKNIGKKLRENRSCAHWDPLSKVRLYVRHITCVFYSWFNFEAYIQNTTNPEKGCEFHNPPKSKVQKSRQTSCFSVCAKFRILWKRSISFLTLFFHFWKNGYLKTKINYIVHSSLIIKSFLALEKSVFWKLIVIKYLGC